MIKNTLQNIIKMTKYDYPSHVFHKRNLTYGDNWFAKQLSSGENYIIYKNVYNGDNWFAKQLSSGENYIIHKNVYNCANKKDNIKSNEYDIKNNDGKYHKLKIYNAESNTLHPWEEDV